MNQPIHWVKSTHYDGLNKQPNVFCPILAQFLECMNSCVKTYPKVLINTLTNKQTCS